MGTFYEDGSEGFSCSYRDHQPVPALAGCQPELLRTYFELYLGWLQKLDSMRSYVLLKTTAQFPLGVEGSPGISKILQWERVADCFHFHCYSFFKNNWAPTVCQTHPLLGISKSPTASECALEGCQSEALTLRMAGEGREVAFWPGWSESVWWRTWPPSESTLFTIPACALQ